jgi:hypothetical protein
MASLAFTGTPACQKQSDAAEPAPMGSSPSAAAKETSAARKGRTRLLEWSFEGAVSPRAAILVPTLRMNETDTRFPVLVALHGRGEARKTPAEGALGWPRDYALTRAIERVSEPPLQPADFEGFIDAIRLDHLNRELAVKRFGGLVVVCPYVPDVDLADDVAIARFGRFVTDVLIPRVRRETPALADAAATGIDGVSLGGALALAVGLDAPLSFGAVGSLQPALDAREAPRWTARAQAARHVHPALALHLLTSDGDYFREAVRTTSAAFTAGGVTHDFDQVIGPHDYPFNRGPGAIEMLLWHDRVLRRSA